MRKILKNKRGMVPFFLILMVILTLIIIYCLLFLPVPAFTKLRMIINYFLIIVFWIIIQIALIYGYYKLGTYMFMFFTILKTKMINWTFNIKKYIITHN